MIEQTKQILNALQWRGVLMTLDQRLAEGSSSGWGNVEFLSALATDEKLYRENLKTSRRIKTAQFRTEACLEQIDFTARRNLAKPTVQDLSTLNFIRQPRNVLICGPTGVGKTYLATALGNFACRSGFTCMFIGVNMLIEKINLCRVDGTFLNYRDRIVKTDLLILDDIGIKRLPPETVQDIYDILEERYQTKSTMITSQLPVKNWKEVIEDPVAFEAIVDRLIHGAITIDLQGESYRKKRAKLAS